MKKKSALSQRQCTVSQVDHNDSKTTWIALQIASAPPPYSPDLAPSDYWLFADLKRMLQEKSFGSNEEVVPGKVATASLDCKNQHNH